MHDVFAGYRHVTTDGEQKLVPLGLPKKSETMGQPPSIDEYAIGSKFLYAKNSRKVACVYEF